MLAGLGRLLALFVAIALSFASCMLILERVHGLAEMSLPAIVPLDHDGKGAPQLPKAFSKSWSEEQQKHYHKCVGEVLSAVTLVQDEQEDYAAPNTAAVQTNRNCEDETNGVAQRNSARKQENSTKGKTQPAISFWLLVETADWAYQRYGSKDPFIAFFLILIVVAVSLTLWYFILGMFGVFGEHGERVATWCVESPPMLGIAGTLYGIVGFFAKNQAAPDLFDLFFSQFSISASATILGAMANVLNQALWSVILARAAGLRTSRASK